MPHRPVGPYGARVNHYAGGWVGQMNSTSAGSWYLATVVNNGSQSAIYSGGSVSSAGYVGVPGYLQFGASAGSAYPGEPLGGDIGEVIIYRRVLSDAERTQTMNYLKSRWSVN